MSRFIVTGADLLFAIILSEFLAAIFLGLSAVFWQLRCTPI